MTIESKIMGYYESLKIRHISEFPERKFYGGQYHIKENGHRGYANKLDGMELLILNWPTRGAFSEWEQEWLDIRQGEEIKGLLHTEEVAFRALLDKYNSVTFLSAEDACVSWHSRGMPIEVAAEVAADKAEFWRLVNEHKAKGNAGKRTSPYGDYL